MGFQSLVEKFFHFFTKNNQSDIEQFIISKNPKNAADVEHFIRQYTYQTHRGWLTNA